MVTATAVSEQVMQTSSWHIGHGGAGRVGGHATTAGPSTPGCSKNT